MASADMAEKRYIAQLQILSKVLHTALRIYDPLEYISELRATCLK